MAAAAVNEQLELVPPETMSLVPVCFHCGARGEPIPVDGGTGAAWHAAACWAYLADLAHRPHCPERNTE